MAEVLSRVRRRFRGHDIFISYARADALSYARALDAALRKKGFRCFLDEREIRAGDHFPKVLDQAVRDSTMLVSLVSPRGLTSAWVQEELRTYLAASGPRLVVPILFGVSSTESLQGTALATLKDFHGVFEAQPVLQAGEVSAGTVFAIQRQFKVLTSRTLRTLALGAFLLALVLTGLVTGDKLMRSRQRASRMEWQEQAVGFKAQKRYDLAELALARAAASEPAAQSELLPLYREARSRRAFTPHGELVLSEHQRLLQWTTHAGRPAVLLRDTESGALRLHRDGAVEELPSCATEPLHAAAGPWLVWACGEVVHRWDLEKGGHSSRRLPREPEELVVAGDVLHLLEREDTREPWLRMLAPSSLEETGRVRLSSSPEGGVLHLCPGREPFAYAVSVRGTMLLVHRWAASNGPGARSWAFAPPAALSGDAPALRVEGAWSTPGCDRLVVRYSLGWIHTSSIPPGYWARLYLKDPRAARPIDDEVRSLVMVDDGAGSEAVFLNAGGDLRRTPEVPFVVSNLPLRTVASEVLAFTAWVAPSEGGRTLRQVAADEHHLLVFEGDTLVARHPVGVERPLRVVSSPDGAFVAVEGHDRLSIWRATAPAVPETIPAFEAVAEELGIDWPEDSPPRYRALQASAKALP
jgi:hypothetical protein